MDHFSSLALSYYILSQIPGKELRLFLRSRSMYTMNKVGDNCKTHPNAETELILTPTGRHYGKIQCTFCKKYIKWARSPTTNAEVEARQNQILDLVEGYNIDRNDLKFLIGVYNKVSLTWGDRSKYAGIMKAAEDVSLYG